jgi:hypothetical protein
MNDERANPDVDRLLADAGRVWRETLPPGQDAFLEFQHRATGGRKAITGRLLGSFSGLLALIAVVVVIAVSLPRSNQIAGASPSPTVNPSVGPSPSSSAAASATPRPTLTPSEAIERLVAFVGEPDLTAGLVADGPNEGAAGPYYGLANSHLTASVDARTGTVISVLYLGSQPPGGDGPTADEAVEIAEAYLTWHGISFDGMTRTVERMDHGETWEWVVKWVRQAGNVVLPDLREVGVDPSGHVWRFVSFSRPYTSPALPKIDQATAETYAIQAAFPDEPRTKIESVTLRLMVDPNGHQRLVWEIVVGAWAPGQPGAEPILHTWVEVDAETGETKILALG